MSSAVEIEDGSKKRAPALHVDRLSEADHVALMGLCSPDLGLSASTIEAYSYAYRRYLGFLTARRDKVMELPPALRLGADHLSAYGAQLVADVGRQKAWATLKALHQCLGVVAPRASRKALSSVISDVRRSKSPPDRISAPRLKAIITLPQSDRDLIALVEQAQPRSGYSLDTHKNAIGDYKRFLGVIERSCPSLLQLPPKERITAASVAVYCDALAASIRPRATADRLRSFKLAINYILAGTDLAPIVAAITKLGEVAQGLNVPSARLSRRTKNEKLALCSAMEEEVLDALEKDDIINQWGAARTSTARGFRYCYLEFVACAARHEPTLIAPEVLQRDLPAMLRHYVAEKETIWKRSTMTTALTSILRVLSRLMPVSALEPLRSEIRSFHYSPSTDFWMRTVRVDELLALGIGICEVARNRLADLRDVDLPYRSLRSLAERYRNGLMIVALGLSALRVTNFSQLAEGTTFIEKFGRYRIAFAGADVKNREDIRLTLAPDSRSYFDDYINWIRDLIAETTDSKPLWLSHRGDPLSVSQIQRIISGVVEDELGVHVTCHDFRRSAASSAGADPANPSDAPEIAIGDRNRRVVDRHYVSPLSASMDALEALAAIADDLAS